MPTGLTVLSCAGAFILGLFIAATADEASLQRRAATGIIFIDNVPYSVRPLKLEAAPS